MSTNQQAGSNPAPRSIDPTGEWLSAAQNGRSGSSDFPRIPAGQANLSHRTSGALSTDEALARLNAASGEALEDAGAVASLWKIWPTVIGGMIALALLGTWAGFAVLGERPTPASPEAQAAATEVESLRPFVLVSFDDKATMAEISRSLRAHGVEIESGPLPGGAYRVTIPAEDGASYDAIAASLVKDPLVGRLVIGRRPSD